MKLIQFLSYIGLYDENKINFAKELPLEIELAFLNLLHLNTTGNACNIKSSNILIFYFVFFYFIDIKLITFFANKND